MLLIVDVGTHKGQECKSFFIKGYKIHQFIEKLIKSIVKLKLSRAKGEFISLLKYLKFQKLIKKNKSKIKIVCIEPNFFHFNNRVYKEADLVLPVASSIRNTDLDIAKLYIADKNIFSQGNSVYKEKSNVDSHNFMRILNLHPNLIAKIIKNEYRDINYKLILRINCEGAEDDTIYNFYSVFGEQMIGVLGSLKDVGEIKGNKKLSEIHYFLKKNKIEFLDFSENINTWEKAHKFILNNL